MNPNALHKLGYGMYVVTSKQEGNFNGQIANTVFQVTSEPPAVAVSINKKNLTWEFISQSQVFAVSVLSQDAPLAFIGQFGFKSGRDIAKLEKVEFNIGQTGAPIVIDNIVSYLEARVTQEIDVGTHTIFVGQVIGAEILNEKTCMTYEYYHQVKRGVTPDKAPTSIKSS